MFSQQQIGRRQLQNYDEKREQNEIDRERSYSSNAKRNEWRFVSDGIQGYIIMFIYVYLKFIALAR